MSRLEELNYLICRCMDIDFYSNSEVFRTKFTRMNKKEWHNIEPYQIRYLDKIYDCSSQIQKFLEKEYEKEYRKEEIKEGKYMVYRPDGCKPKYTHDNYESAYEEARRLMEKEMKEIQILKIEKVLRPEEVQDESKTNAQDVS